MARDVIVVTGASGGLGRAVVGRFLDAGARVMAVGRKRVVEEGVEPVVADLATVDGAREAVRQVLDKAGRIDALAHLVGGFAGGQPVGETDEEIWERMLTINLVTARRMLRAVLPLMIEQRRGRIVAVGSRAGTIPAPTLAAYCASKAALHMLVECAAAEAKDAGVAVNAVLPGTIDTPANRAAMPSADPSQWVRPEAIADLIVWLATAAPADVNGALIPVYGRS